MHHDSWASILIALSLGAWAAIVEVALYLEHALPAYL
jgi:hypothetical protein